MAQSDLQTLLDFALELAHVAEQEILPRYTNHTVSLKADGTEVTVADRQAEAAMRDQIRTAYPHHRILGEEFGETSGSSQYQWVLDPVDGTSWYTLGVPLFGTLIGLVDDTDPIAGVIHLPVAQETIYAAKGLGCWFKAKQAEPVKVQVKTSTSMADATLSASGLHNTTLIPILDKDPYALEQVIQASGRFKFCGDCSQHALVCRGKIQAAIDTVMQPWDIAALVPCVEEAGGQVSNLEGQRHRILTGGSLLTSCGGSLHTQILDLIRC